MSTENQLAERSASSVKEYLALPAYRDRFHEVMGKRAPQFMAAIVSLSQSQNLRDSEPKSVIAAAMVAATLDLPVNPALGMAHVVSYGDRTGAKIAQFQVGYKGYIQLALRSGQYKRLNAGPVNAEVFKGYDIVGEPILDWTELDPSKEPAGYFCAFEMLNGFTKVVYWPKKQVEAHAKRFSKAYQKGYQSSPWFSDFDSMATKTVIKNAITKWGVLSVEMQKAAVHDQAGQIDVDTEPVFVDRADDEAKPVEPITDRPAPKPRAARGVKAAVEASVEVVAEPANETPAEAAKVVEAPKASEPVKEAPKSEAHSDLEPAAPVQESRAFLKDGEEYTCVVEVEEATAVLLNKVQPDGTKVPTASASVKSKGGYVGSFFRFDGAAGNPMKLLPIWTVGNHVRVKLLGRKNKSTGNIIVKAETAELLEDAARNGAAEDDVE